MKKLPMSISGAFFISNRCNGKPLPQKKKHPVRSAYGRGAFI